MILDELIEELKKREPSTVVNHGFGRGHSDRGNCCDACFEPVEETTLGEMLRNAIEIKGTLQSGYSGSTQPNTRTTGPGEDHARQ
jgi:hypothetical protein